MIGKWTESWAQHSNIQSQYLKETSSTNDLAKNLELETPFAIITDYQTLGRGRGSNQWASSQPGDNLFATFVFSLETAPQPIASPLIGLALYNSVQTTWKNLSFSLKAPNDLYLDSKKVAGLLIEVLSTGNAYKLLIGLGLNVQSHPEKIPTATSLSEELKRPILNEEWSIFLNHWLVEISQLLGLITHTTIPSAQCNEILNALNKNPNLKSKYLNLRPDGGLETSQGHIPWSSL